MALPFPAAPTAGRGSASRRRPRSIASGRRWSISRLARTASASTPTLPIAGSTPRTSPARGAARGSGWSRRVKGLHFRIPECPNSAFATRSSGARASRRVAAAGDHSRAQGDRRVSSALRRHRAGCGPAAPRAEAARSQAVRRALPGPGTGLGSRRAGPAGPGAPGRSGRADRAAAASDAARRWPTRLPRGSPRWGRFSLTRRCTEPW